MTRAPKARNLAGTEKIRLEHDREKWIPVSRLREALAGLLVLA
jgi:hypothetical protein